MVLKQASQTCYCGRPMEFPEAEVKTKCICGALWVLGPEGYWYSSGSVTQTTKTKSSRYERYMSRRNKRKGKGGRK